MALPDFVFLQTIKAAWKFLQERPEHLTGYLLSEFDLEKRERFRDMIVNESLNVHYGYPQAETLLPAVSIILQSETETIPHIGNEGVEDRDPLYPTAGDDDYPDVPEYYGVTYGQTYQPQFLGGEDLESKTEPTNHPLPVKNSEYQNAGGDEQYESLEIPLAMYDRVGQRTDAVAVEDLIKLGALITTDNAEKTAVYSRLLRVMLLLFTGSLHSSGLKNPKYSAADLSPVENLMPTVSGSPVFQRMITLECMYESIFHTTKSILLDWMLEYRLATQNQDKTYSYVPLYTFTGGFDPRTQ